MCNDRLKWIHQTRSWQIHQTHYETQKREEEMLSISNEIKHWYISPDASTQKTISSQKRKMKVSLIDKKINNVAFMLLHGQFFSRSTSMSIRNWLLGGCDFSHGCTRSGTQHTLSPKEHPHYGCWQQISYCASNTKSTSITLLLFVQC